PLAWQEVLGGFHSEGDPWELDFGDGTISGRTIGSGPPLYFLNGLLGSHEIFCLLAWLLRDSFRCVLMDHPRFVNPKGARTIDDRGRAIFAVAHAHGDERFDVFASGFGGQIA